MKSKTELILVSLVAFGLGMLVMKTLSRPENTQLDLQSVQTIESIFSSGCEVGIMKNCAVNKQEDCRRFCILFTEANPDVIKLILEGSKKSKK